MMKTRRKVSSLALILAIGSATLFIIISSLVSSAQAPPPGQGSWTHQWTKLVDSSGGSIEFMVIESSEGVSDSDDRALVWSSLKKVFIVKVNSGITEYSESITPPLGTLVFPKTHASFLARSCSGKYSIWMNSNPKQITIYNTQNPGQVQTVSLTTVPNVSSPAPVSVSITPMGRYILVGDDNGYVYAYFNSLAQDDECAT